MSEKKIMDVEDLMLDYAEMTSFDFGSLTNEEMNTLNKITNNEYMKSQWHLSMEISNCLTFSTHYYQMKANS